MEYIYLDWNVIQYMKHSTVENSIDGPAFAELVRKLSHKYRFPFSEGHLRDLAVSFNPENRFIEEDIKYLNKLSVGYALGVDSNESLVITNEVNIFEEFKGIVEEIKKEQNFEVSGESCCVDGKKLPKNDLFRTLLESNNGVLDATVMQNFLLNVWEHIDDPQYYKLFRNQVSDLKNRFNSVDTILNQQSDYFKGLVPFLDFLVTNDLQILEDNFNETLKSFLSIDGRSFYNMKQGRIIELAYMLLDYHPEFREHKINKKNKPSNICRDCKNLFFASQAKYYITEDLSSLKKALFVCKTLSIKVKVLCMSEFIHKFC